METPTKICSVCGIEYPLTPEFFYRRKENKDGFKSPCKNCERKRIKEYNQRPNVKKNNRLKRKRYNSTHKEQIKERNIRCRKLYGDKYRTTENTKYATNIEYRKRKLAYRKKYYDMNCTSVEAREKINEKCRQKTIDLSDNYIKLLIKGNTDISYREIPKELIEIKRKQQKLIRDVKRKQQHQ